MEIETLFLKLNLQSVTVKDKLYFENSFPDKGTKNSLINIGNSTGLSNLSSVNLYSYFSLLYVKVVHFNQNVNAIKNSYQHLC